MGVACAFPIPLHLIGGDQGQNLTFFDRNGNVVREMGTATHATWRITNLDTEKSNAIGFNTTDSRSDLSALRTSGASSP